MPIGLDDVIAAETTLSDVDGLAGRLLIRGHSLEDLAGQIKHEEVLSLLWDEQFPDVQDLAPALGRARVAVFDRIAARLPDIASLAPFDATRALIAELPDGEDLDGALLLDAAPGVLLPALLRQRAGKQPIAPEAALGHAADILRMLDGRTDPARAAALDTYLVTVSDHGLNASTFAARVVASTGAGLVSSSLAALGALKGPLHGGAPGPVLDLLDEVESPERAHAVLSAKLDRGERLMGFGHRIYRVRDPRADALKAALARLRSTSGDGGHGRLDLALAVEQTALALLRERKPDRPLDTNVEFFTALLLDALGFPRDAFTAVFAIGRIGGWIAHSREQARTGRLIRPKSHYIGPLPGGPQRNVA